MSGAQHISAALARVQQSQTNAITDRAFELRAAGRDVISLSVGEPDFATPENVIDAAKGALDAGDTKYTPVTGTDRLKGAAALHFERDLGLATEPSRVIVTAGGKQAIFLALLATIDPGDEVVIPAPWWVSYPEIVRFAGGTVVPAATHAAQQFALDPDALAEAIGPRTRWLLLNSPGNPTGAVYPRETLHAIADVLRAHPQVLVLSDDIYAPIRYDGGRHATLAVECPDLADRVLTLSGVSKSHAMTGFRIGVATGPAWLIGAMGRLESHNSGNPASISQAAAVAAFEGPQDFLAGWRETFRGRRDKVVSALNAIPGVSCPVPQGAFYALADAGALIGPGRRFADDEQLALHLLDHGVAVVHASAFGGAHCGLAGFRISFATADDKLDEALNRIAAALA